MKRITKESILNFKEKLIEEEKSENTIDKYTRDVSFFMMWLDKREVTKILALQYKRELCDKYAPVSVNAAVASLNKFFAFMGWFDMRVRPLKIQRQIFSRRDRELTKAEYERLLVAAKSKNNEKLYYLNNQRRRYISD